MSIGKYTVWGEKALQILTGVAGGPKGNETGGCKRPIKVKQAREGQLYIPLV